jgi:carboxyl-terminal processing protease
MRSIVSILLSCCLFVAPAMAQSWRDAALASFDLTWQTIDESYYDPTFGGIDWKAVREELRPGVERAPSADSARDVIRQMLSRLGESHFVLLPSSPTVDSLPGPAAVPIDVRVDDGSVVITRVEPKSSAETAGLAAGDVVLGIDREQADDWRARAAAVPEKVRALQMWRTVTRALYGNPYTIARIRIERPGVPDRDYNVLRTRASGSVVTIGNLPPLQVNVDVRSVRTPQRREVGVIGFNLWMPQINDPVASGVDRFRTSAGIVFDLRGNAGGLAEMMRGIAGHVLDEPLVLGRMQTRQAALEFKANPRRSRPDGKSVTPFAGPVAILVDDLSGSTSECFAGGLQDLGRARVFGRQTMGQALPAVTKGLPNGDTLMYVLGDFVTSKGRRLEGVGVVPDQAVRIDRRALAEGRDPDLEAALQWIDQQGRRKEVFPTPRKFVNLLCRAGCCYPPFTCKLALPTESGSTPTLDERARGLTPGPD